MVTRVCRHCGAITEHQTAAEVKGRIACPACGQVSVLLTEKQASDLAKSRRETERNNTVDFHCPRCKYHIVGTVKGKIFCHQCHSLWNRSNDDCGIVLDQKWEKRVSSNSRLDKESKSKDFNSAMIMAEYYNSGILYFKAPNYIKGEMIGDRLCPLCRLFLENHYVTTIRDIISHRKAIPPFSSCRCPTSFGVKIEACYPDMYDKPENVDFVDLDSVIETVELYENVCAGKSEIPFESRLKIIPEKEYISDYKSGKIGLDIEGNKKASRRKTRPIKRISCFGVFVIVMIIYFILKQLK